MDHRDLRVLRGVLRGEAVCDHRDLRVLRGKPFVIIVDLRVLRGYVVVIFVRFVAKVLSFLPAATPPPFLRGWLHSETVRAM